MWLPCVLAVTNSCYLLAQVNGYVKNVSKVGVFVTIACGIDARVKLGQLSSTFVEDPAVAFPSGKLVKGRILSVTGNRSACCLLLPPFWYRQCALPPVI